MSYIKRSKSFIQNWITFRNAYALYAARIMQGDLRVLKLWNGAVFHVENVNNNLGTVLEVFNAREYRDLESLRGRSNATIIDIGANIGTFTVWAAGILPTATIYSYEPETKNYELLKRNIIANGLEKRAQAFLLAVCGDVGVRTLTIAGESSGKNSLSYDVGTGVSSQVTCTTLERIFIDNKITHCDCLKIDCEGAEYEILYNTAPEHLKKVRMMIIEHHGVEGESVEELTKFLKQQHFTIEHSKMFNSMFTARRIGEGA